MTVLLLSLLLAGLSYGITAWLVPKPKGTPIPLTYGSLAPRPLKVRIVAEPEPEFDPSAFWLYPDWDGPIKEPFWMRPLKLPVGFNNLPNFSGQSMIPGVRYRTAGGGTIMVRDLAKEARTGVVKL